MNLFCDPTGKSLPSVVYGQEEAEVLSQVVLLHDWPC